MKSVSSLINERSKYNVIAAIIAGGLLATIILSFFLIRPAWGNLKKLGTEIPAEQVKRDKAQLDAQNLENARKFFNDKKDAVEAVNTAVPAQPAIPSILVVLEDLARQNNVFLTSFAPQQLGAAAGAAGGATGTAGDSAGAAGDSAGAANVNSVEITANYKGQYSSLINFFFSLERSLRLVDVKTLNVNSSQAGALDGSITFRAYYKTPDGAAGGTK